MVSVFLVYGFFRFFTEVEDEVFTFQIERKMRTKDVNQQKPKNGLRYCRR